MTDYVRCCVGSCLARVPIGGAPVCSLHQSQVELGVTVEDGDQGTTARRFIPITDPECEEAANEPLLRPRRAVRQAGRWVHEFGVPMS